MFNIMEMMGKVQQAQQKVEETKKRLDNVYVDETSSDGLLKVSVTANGYVKSVEISQDLMQDKEQLEDYLVLLLNKALKGASQIHQQEISAVAKEGMPNIPGLNLF